MIDLQAAIIVDVQATPARWTAEVDATKAMLERTETCFDLKPRRLAADAAYGCEAWSPACSNTEADFESIFT